MSMQVERDIAELKAANEEMRRKLAELERAVRDLEELVTAGTSGSGKGKKAA